MNLFYSMLGVGLVTSIHCVFMCGGLVLTYAVKGAEGGPWYRRLVPHLAYQGSKIVSYATVAIILGSLVALLGRAVDITPLRNWLLVGAGVYMVLLGLSMTGKFPILAHLSPRPPKFLVDALSRNRKRAVAEGEHGTASLATPISFGLLTGLMPCAPLIAAQAAAMSSGSPALGALAMVGFGLGTMPLMLVFGFASSLLSRQFQAKLQIVAALAVMTFGLVIFNRGLMVVGSPVTFDTVRTAALGGPVTGSSGFKTASDGVVEIPLKIENTTFVPQTISLPADKPVRLVVDRREAVACSKQLAIPQAGVLANLADNAVTTVTVPPMKAGSYTLTCGMGMMAGSVSVGGGTGSSTARTPLAVLAVVLLVGGASATLWVRGQRRRADDGRESVPERGKRPSDPARKGGRPSAAPDALVLGFTPVEIVIGATFIVGAALMGLAAGGFFQ